MSTGLQDVPGELRRILANEMARHPDQSIYEICYRIEQRHTLNRRDYHRLLGWADRMSDRAAGLAPPSGDYTGWRKAAGLTGTP